MTEPTDPRRPPSAPSDPVLEFLNRYRERPETGTLIQFGYDGLHDGVRDLLAQLSAYVTAAEGREARFLIKPSDVANIIAQRDNATELAEARYKPLLAERDAEIERLRKRIWPNGEGG